MCSRVESQSECFKPERFGELTSAQFLDTIDVSLAKVKNAASIDTERKLERRVCFVSLHGIFFELRIFSFKISQINCKYILR